MYSFLTLIFGLFIKLSLIQEHATQNYVGIRTGYNDRTNHMINNEFNNVPPVSNKPSQNGVQDSIPRHYDEERNIVSIGNGYNKNNVVIINNGHRRRFQERPEKPIFGIRNTNRPKLGSSSVVSIANIGNGRNNQNSVIIQDDFHSTSQFVNTSPTNDNQRYDYVNFFRNNRGPPNSINTFGNRNSNWDGTDFNYSQIGHGPDNSNTVIINGKVYSSPDTTVIHRKDVVTKTDTISNNGYHSLSNDDDLKVLPTENRKKNI